MPDLDWFISAKVVTQPSPLGGGFFCSQVIVIKFD
jgi:hypothetical protein